MIDMIAFDADDTLWHSEVLYASTQARFRELLAPYRQGDNALQELYETEMRNLQTFGYGVKGFALSMIETAITLTGGRIRGDEIQQIIGFAKEMLSAPIQLLDGVEEAVQELSREHRLMIITKGDLFDQETKVARSGLVPYFDQVEIVSGKTAEVYRSLLEKHGLAPGRFVMVGNSLRSDILPVLELGGHAIHIPYEVKWAHEAADRPHETQARYAELEGVAELPAYVDKLRQRDLDDPLEVSD
jgi:putative hydrolase of the HAD superfamily